MIYSKMKQIPFQDLLLESLFFTLIMIDVSSCYSVCGSTMDISIKPCDDGNGIRKLLFFTGS